MAISVLTRLPENFGSQSGAVGTLQLDASYPTGGYSLPPELFQLSQINSFLVTTDDASLLFYNYTTEKLMAFTAAGGDGGTTDETSAGTPAGTNGTSSVSGTGTYVGAPTGLSPVLSGTGLTAAGQVITTTDNQTMGLNQYAGYWLVSATGATPPNLILSNTAVTGAPAVFTVQGSANTDAGAYDVVGTTSSGSVSALSGTAAAQAFSGAPLATHTHSYGGGGGGLSEVKYGTNLSTVVGNYIVIGQ